MTIKELVEKLNQYDPGMRVVVSGYESEYTELSKDSPHIMRLHMDAGYAMGVCGEHKEHIEGYCFECDEKKTQPISCVVLSR
jgi:hypothetical protein